MDITLQTLGVIGQTAGVALLYLHWRARNGLSGAILAAGWALIALGTLPWLLNVSVERAIAIALLAPMAVGLFLLAPGGVADLRRGTKDRSVRMGGTREATPPAPEKVLSGRLSRDVARWTGALVVVPALALSTMAAWQAFTPGSAANRVGFSIFALIVMWTAALLWLLASEHPWRVTALTLLGAVMLGGSVFILKPDGVA